MFWRAFKEGLAFRAGMEALGFLPRFLRELFRLLFWLLAFLLAAALLKALWWLALPVVLGYAYWRYRKFHREGGKRRA